MKQYRITTNGSIFRIEYLFEYNFLFIHHTEWIPLQISLFNFEFDAEFGTLEEAEKELSEHIKRENTELRAWVPVTFRGRSAS